MAAASWTTRWRWDTKLSADSAEWCPVPPHTDVLVCGTYQLNKGDEANQKRLGRIYVFRINDETTTLNPVHTVEISGILDQKWCYHTIDNHPVLAVVTSDGFVKLFKLITEEGECKLELWMEESIGESILALSVDWSTNKLRSAEPRLVVSDSSGSVTVFAVQDKLDKLGTWNCHGFEAWIAAFNYWNPDVFYSGGDDCLFKSHDVRAGGGGGAGCSSRAHDAGVTSVRSSVDVEHQLLTGSYDENVRLWDARAPKRPVTETNVNGGVWRLKYHPRRPASVLAACMYGGFRILNVEGDSITVVNEYMEHDSIAYGADWKFSEDGNMVATCSFYDCKLHVGNIVFEA
ncbi:hypothetical protein JYU34_013105 [Plutella xylostella]|uniref:methylated diphthine methylhydrolase n=1 Tax=Plutella xylostella TaxID=51655 RepID=A0ABQ7QDV4_PLUXY|nr:hypothetical protein JYU34_013105 [Plutella xylostella]